MVRSRLVGLVAVAASVLLAISASAQETPSLETVLQKHAEALGGMERLDAVDTLRLSGTFIAFSEEGTFTLTRMRPNGYLLRYQMLGSDLVESYDGEDAWTIHPDLGLPQAVPMNHAERAAVQAQADFFGPLIRPDQKGHTVTLVGRSDFEGTDAWELSVVRSDETEETWYLDVDSYLPVGRRTVTTDWGRPHPLTVFYDDWREVDGIQLPFYWENEFFIRHQIVQVEEAEVNPTVEAADFDRPVPEERARLARLQGEWDVAVESRLFPQAPWTNESGTAKIESELDGMLLVERIQYEDQGRPVQAVRTWVWDRDDEVYRITHTDDFQGSTEVYEGAWNEEDGTLHLVSTPEAPEEPEASDDAESDGDETGEDAEDGDDASAQPTPMARWSLSELTDDGFFIEHSVSQDGGETWIPTRRFRYGSGGGDEGADGNAE